MQLTAPSAELKLANRELGTVESIGESRMTLKMDGGRSVEIDQTKHQHLDHGYAVTSHSSQGQTANRVLINVDTELGAKDLLNNRMAYVAVLRGAHDAQLFTHSRDGLGAALGHDVSHKSAHVPELKTEQAIEPKVESSIREGTDSASNPVDIVGSSYESIVHYDHSLAFVDGFPSPSLFRTAQPIKKLLFDLSVSGDSSFTRSSFPST